MTARICSCGFEFDTANVGLDCPRCHTIHCLKSFAENHNHCKVSTLRDLNQSELDQANK